MLITTRKLARCGVNRALQLVAAAIVVEIAAQQERLPLNERTIERKLCILCPAFEHGGTSAQRLDLGFKLRHRTRVAQPDKLAPSGSGIGSSNSRLRAILVPRWEPCRLTRGWFDDN